MQRIANPFASYPNVVVKVNDDPRRTQVIGTAREIEVDDDAEVVVFGPIDGGRSDAPAVAEPAIWTPDNGVQSIKQYEESARIAEEAKKLKEEQEAAAARKAKEARERKAKEAVSEKPKRVIEEKKSS